jgi:ADP-ribose pyrophosphatase YjhB (NUDIX family)
MYSYDYPHPAVTVDSVILTIRNNQHKLLLIRRANNPYKGEWALPGGFVDENESLEAAAQRELKEETGMTGINLEQLYTFGAPERDPRERVITVAYYALIPSEITQLHAATDAEAVRWFSMNELPKLAFDHSEIVKLAHERVIAGRNIHTSQ